jgi:lysozyme
VVEGDPEHGQPVGTPVDEERVHQVFDSDITSTLDECKVLYPDFDDLPEEAQLIIANMMFNMGRPRLSKFKGMKAGVDARDWNRAADEMVDSRWYNQVTNRAERLVKRMRSLS